jgi:uncharacterized protein YbjQ (UPF0145 family)
LTSVVIVLLTGIHLTYDMTMKYKQKLVGLRADQLRKLSQKAKAMGISVNAVIRMALDNGLPNTLTDRGIS